MGLATYMAKDETPARNSHFWNVLPVADNNGESSFVVVDIYSLKSDRCGVYVGHRGDPVTRDYINKVAEVGRS